MGNPEKQDRSSNVPVAKMDLDLSSTPKKEPQIDEKIEEIRMAELKFAEEQRKRHPGWVLPGAGLPDAPPESKALEHSLI